MQALALCQAAGMVSLGRVALDGTKVRANASKRKAMSYARMSEKEKVLAGEVSALLAEAQRIDKAEDAEFGKNNRGDELPEELRRRETRLARIREAKAALEEQAAQSAREHAEQRATDRGDDEDTAAGQPEQARPCLDTALQLARDTGMCFYDAELLRLRAHTHTDPDVRQADLELARRQGATLFELRAALDDYELRGEPARAALVDVVSRFPAGSAFPELARAQAALQ